METLGNFDFEKKNFFFRRRKIFFGVQDQKKDNSYRFANTLGNFDFFKKKFFFFRREKFFSTKAVRIIFLPQYFGKFGLVTPTTKLGENSLCFFFVERRIFRWRIPMFEKRGWSINVDLTADTWLANSTLRRQVFSSL